MADKDWPSWRYGPSGEAQIFQREADVPKGWVDSPSKLPPAPEKLGGEVAEGLKQDAARSSLEALRACEEAHRRLSSENEMLSRDLAQARYEAANVVADNWRLRDELTQLRKQIPTAAPEKEQPATARRPRKLSAGAKGTPFTAADETVTLDEGRTERLKVLRDAGVTISDDATDGDIEEALDWLEKQVEAQGNREG